VTRARNEQIRVDDPRPINTLAVGMAGRVSATWSGRGSQWRARVLVIDDEAGVAARTEQVLGPDRFQIEHLNSLAAARSVVDQAGVEGLCSRPVFVFLEPELDPQGGSLVRALRALVPRPAIAVIGRDLDNSREIELKLQGVEICLRKPLRPEEVTRLMAMLLRAQETLTAVGIYGASAGLSEGQKRVLLCALEGVPIKATASHLGVSPETVRTQWGRILLKTGHTCPAAVLVAARRASEQWLALPVSA
jgi:DNA-binding NarL/FixJ family response regulator